MATYLVIPLTATAMLVAFGSVILALGSRQRANRISGAMLLGGGYWAFCDVLWNVAPDTQTAIDLHRLAIPGFVFIGPLGLALMSEVTERPVRWISPVVWVYAIFSAIIGLLGMSTPWMVADMVDTSWGRGLVPGPLFTVWVGTLVGVVGIGSVLFGRSFAKSSSATERTYGPEVLGLITVPFLIGAVTDAILPILGFQPPRIGSICFAASGGGMLWATRRYGYSLLSYRDMARRILRNLPDGFALTSLTGRVRVVNDALNHLLGCRSGEAIGRPLVDILDLTLLDPPREVSQLSTTLHADDGTAIPVLVSSSLVVDNDRSVLGLAVVVSDQREVASLRNRVMTSDRLAAVGQLAAGIAHEINNPLAFVRSNLNLLRDQWRTLDAQLDSAGLPEDMRAHTDDWEDLLSESLEGVDRAVTIVADVKDFSHVGVGKLSSASVPALLDHVIRMAGPQFGVGVQVVRDYRYVESIHCLPQRLKQLFLNLIVNAAQSIEGVGHVWVSTCAEENTVLVRVEDDGCGIPVELQGRIFDPFFTTKPVGVGTGLGLAISHEIVRAHGGVIEATARRGGGTCVSVWLPHGDDG